MNIETTYNKFSSELMDALSKVEQVSQMPYDANNVTKHEHYSNVLEMQNSIAADTVFTWGAKRAVLEKVEDGMVHDIKDISAELGESHGSWSIMSTDNDRRKLMLEMEKDNILSITYSAQNTPSHAEIISVEIADGKFYSKSDEHQIANVLLEVIRLHNDEQSLSENPDIKFADPEKAVKSAAQIAHNAIEVIKIENLDNINAQANNQIMFYAEKQDIKLDGMFTNEIDRANKITVLNFKDTFNTFLLTEDGPYKTSMSYENVVKALKSGLITHDLQTVPITSENATQAFPDLQPVQDLNKSFDTKQALLDVLDGIASKAYSSTDPENIWMNTVDSASEALSKLEKMGGIYKEVNSQLDRLIDSVARISKLGEFEATRSAGDMAEKSYQIAVEAIKTFENNNTITQPTNTKNINQQSLDHGYGM